MTRTRVVLLSVSLVVVLLFSGILMASKTTDEELFRAMGNLAEVVHLVLTEYVDELDREALASSLEAGLVESVDPWAAVLPSEVVKEYNRMLESPPPFGLVLGMRLSLAAVRHTFAGSPAETAGLKTWEVIERVDGVNTRGQPLWQIRLDLLEREREGKEVTLTVIDRHVDERREVILMPQPWQVRPVEAEERDGVLVVRLQSLPAGAADEVERAVGGASTLILDLRELVWGLEAEAIKTADLFLNDGDLGVWRGRRAGEETFSASQDAAVPEQLVVIVGSNTEGVGEILAAGLDRSGAQLVGTTTAGHAPHMRLVRDGDLNLWLPVAHWLRSDDTPIDRNGIEPGEVVEAEPETEDNDPALERALDLVRVEEDIAA